MKLLKVLCVMALVFAVSGIAYAETQSVKVSGDITMRAFARNDYDLWHDDTSWTVFPGVEAGVRSTDWSTFLLSTAEVQVDADLTDNVSGVVRLINQKVWGDDQYTNQVYGQMMQLTPNGLNQWGELTGNAPVRVTQPLTENAFSVQIDLAYIELKEFLYSPLTLRIGRQDLWFGRGFIIGANLYDPGWNIWAPEYTAIRSFDAIRATLDYDPWTIDAVFAKISENARQADDDINLWGVNVGYVFDNYNAEIEAYWFMKQSRNPGPATYFDIIGTDMTSLQNSNVLDNSVHTLGGRGSFDPIEDWTVAIEGAYQTGAYMIPNQTNKRTRNAWALDIMLECRAWQDDMAWRPVVGVEYIFYSGEKDLGNQTVASTGDFEGWDPMFRGKFDTAIREWQNVYYPTAQASTPSFTNQHQVLVRGTVEPTDSLTFNAVYAHFWLAEQFSTANTKNNIGDEVDLQLTWDYTEDVSFGLLTAWFIPGDFFQDERDDVATDIVATAKLSF